MSGGLASRRKGMSGEYEVRDILRDHGYEARRGDQRGEHKEADVETTLPGFHLEVKRQEKTEIWKWFRQADDDIPPDDDETIPAVVFRRSRSPWMVCLRFEDLLDLLER